MTLVQPSVLVRERMGRDRDRDLVQGAFTCDECSMMSIALLDRTRRSYGPQTGAEALEDGRDALLWLPLKGTGPTFDDVPEHIADAASEAYKVASIGAYRAAALMARSVVEATAKAKGVTDGVLAGKINAMRDSDLIREHVKEAAHEIRHLGNDMAHGDFVEPTTKEEAEEVLSLMAEILHEVFQSPAKIEARKAARMAKQSPSMESSTAQTLRV
jgi:hypothetical protein